MDIHPVIQAILIGLPATILGILAYRRSRKVDAVAEQSGVATETRAGIAQIIQGLNDMIENLQEDNQVFRAEGKDWAVRIKNLDMDFATRLRDLTVRLDAISQERDEFRRERDECRREVARLFRKYGEDNGPKEKVSD